jgi:uncharacterized protein (TIGR02611 family)
MEVIVLKTRLNRWLAPLPRPIRRILIGSIGATLLVAGALMLVLPGPGIVVILLALALLATEFAWAEALLIKAKNHAGRIKNKFTRPDGGQV